MNKVSLVKGITKGYFVAALAGSATHIIASSHKLGGTGYEAMVTPLMIDGVAVIGMVMRSDEFSERTNKIGLIVQCGMGTLSLAMNVYAAHNLFGVLFGIAIVGLFILAEWLGDQIEGREVDEDAKAKAANAWIAACGHPTKCASAVQCATKTAAVAKARKTTARKVKLHKAQTAALQSLLDAPVTAEDGVRILKAV